MNTSDSNSSSFIARPSSEAANRDLPEIRGTLLQGNHLADRLAQVPITTLQRHLGIWMNPGQRLSRLLVLQREAFQAELMGRTKRADFFWQEVHDVLRASWTDTAMWVSAGGNHVAVSADENAGLAHRQRLLEEIFIDTHIAFYNGRVAHEDTLVWDDRAFVHAGYAAKLAELAGYTPEAMKYLMLPAGELQIGLCRAAGRCAEGLVLCRAMANRFPESPPFQHQLAVLHFESALASLKNGADSAAYASDAQCLAHSLEALEEDRMQHRDNSDLYTVASQLELLRSIKLANADQVADALVSVKRAHAYVPDQEEIHDIEARLNAKMQTIKQHSDDLLKKLQAGPNIALTDDGRRLVAEAQAGATFAVRFEKSTEAAEIRRAGEHARQCAAEMPAAAPVWNAPAEGAPLVTAQTGASSGDGAPFGWWLLSRRDLVAKAVAGLGCCVLLYAGLSAHTQGQLRATRSVAYAAMQRAAVQSDDDALIRAAESFLGASAWGSDARDAEVWQRYEQAFVRWFSSRGYVLDEAARSRVERFRSLTATPAKASK